MAGATAHFTVTSASITPPCEERTSTTSWSDRFRSTGRVEKEVTVVNGEITFTPGVMGEPTLPKVTGTPTSYAPTTWTTLVTPARRAAISAPSAPRRRPERSMERPTR